MDVVDLERAVAAHLPDDFLDAMIRSIFLAKQLAHEHCKAEFSAKTSVNVTAYYCRAKVQDLMHGAAKRVPGFTSTMKPASGWTYTEVTAGPFTMTAHPVDYPCSAVDDAQYRRSLAESQPSFYDPAELMPDAKLYGLFVYSPYRGRDAKETARYAFLPGSVYLAFPEAALKGYAHAINLYERFPAVLDGLLPKEWDGEARLIYRWQAKQQKAA